MSSLVHRIAVLLVACGCVVAASPQRLAAQTPGEILEQIRMPRDLSLDQQVALLERLERDHPDAPETIAARAFLARRAARDGREEQAIQWWRELSELAPYQPPPGSGQEGLWAEIGVGQSLMELARYAEGRGEWEEALARWQRVQPFGWCGNGQDAIVAERNWRVAKCLLKLGREDEAMVVLEEEVFRDSLTCEIDTVMAWLRLSQRRGTLDAARARLTAERQYVLAGVDMGREVIAMLDAGAAGHLEELWPKLESLPGQLNGYRFSWRECLALRLITMAPDAGMSLARLKLGAEDIDERNWAMVAIAAIDPGEGLTLTRSLVAALHDDREATYVLPGAFFALQMKGAELPAGARYVQRVAAGGAEFAGDDYASARLKARQVLDRFPSPQAAWEAAEFRPELPDLARWSGGGSAAVGLLAVGAIAAVAAGTWTVTRRGRQVRGTRSPEVPPT